MVTPKHEVRIDTPKWYKSMAKANAMGSSNAEVINILIDGFLAGRFDDVVSAALEASADGGGQTGQAPAG